MTELTYTQLTERNRPLDPFILGMVEATYDKLVSLFGEPEITGHDKTQVEWAIEWSDGTISTIYDWKCYGEEPEEITGWSIGGFNGNSLFYVQELVNPPIKKVAASANKKIVVVVIDGVADYYTDEGIEVLVIDTDYLDSGDVNIVGDYPSLTSEEIEGFEHLVPAWIKDDYLDKDLSE